MGKTKRKKNYSSRRITPYGLKKFGKNFYCKVDYHLHSDGRKLKNWWEWEEINNKVVRKAIKQKLNEYRLVKLND